MSNKTKLAQRKPAEIVTTLRQVEVQTRQGMPRLDAIRQIGVTEDVLSPECRRAKKSVQWTVYPPNKCGGTGTDQLKELKCLQRENKRLRRAVSDPTLDTLILAEAAKGVSSG